MNKAELFELFNTFSSEDWKRLYNMLDSGIQETEAERTARIEEIVQQRKSYIADILDIDNNFKLSDLKSALINWQKSNQDKFKEFGTVENQKRRLQELFYIINNYAGENKALFIVNNVAKYLNSYKI